MPTGGFGSALKMLCGICGEEHKIWEMVYRCGRCDYPLGVLYDYNEVLEEVEEGASRAQGSGDTKRSSPSQTRIML